MRGREARKALQEAVRREADKARGQGVLLTRLGASRSMDIDVADVRRLPVADNDIELQDPVSGALYILADYSVADGPDVAG
jgi:hypothetical protein